MSSFHKPPEVLICFSFVSKEPSSNAWFINREKGDLCWNLINHESTNMQKVLQAMGMNEGIERNNTKDRTLGIPGVFKWDLKGRHVNILKQIRL